ncbi:MAG: M20/M25/M40 family metallo-hydrolase, partial [Sciscionella sp.]
MSIGIVADSHRPPIPGASRVPGRDNGPVIGSLLGTTGRLGTTRRVVAALLGLLVLAAVVVAALLVDDSTPRPRPASAPASEFSAERAMTQLRHFATRPHPIGSAASDTTRNYLQARLRAAGLRVHTGRGVGHAEFPGGAVLGRVANIVATLPGRDPTGSVIIAAHYDSVADGPGAADDGSSVASMLETVRALRAGGPLRNDVVLLITDGEEPGLLGSSAFVRDDPLARRRGVVLNWEARGTSGPSLMFETSRNNAKLIDIFAEGAPHPHGDSSLVELYRLLPNDTDFSNLRTRLPGLNSAFIGDVRFYHTAQDSVANLDWGTLQQHGANMLGLSRAFGDTDLSTLASDHDETYFRFLGLLVHYSDVVTYLLAVLAVLAVLAFAALARRRRIASMPRMLLGAGSVLLPLVVAAALAQGLWWLVSTVRPEFSDALYRGLAFQLAVLALVVLAVATWYGLLRKRIGPAALAVGGLGFLAVLGALCVVALPGMSFLFAVPALTGALGGLLALLVPGRVSALPVAVLGAAPAMVLLVPFGLLTLSGFGFEMGGAGAAAAVLVLSGLPLLAIVELALPVDEGSAWRVSAVPLAALLAVVLLTAG